jgi:hypothetical protein
MNETFLYFIKLFVILLFSGEIIFLIFKFKIKFFPKIIKKVVENNTIKVIYYDENGNVIHNQVVEENNVPNLLTSLNSNILQPDFNSPTSVTVNIPSPEVKEEVVEKENINRLDIIGVSAYCVKCRCKNLINDPVEHQIDGKKGIRRYMTGFCGVCNTKMSVMLKRSD